MRVRELLIVTVLCGGALLAVACGGSAGSSATSACEGGGKPFVVALESAPRPVRLAGGIAIGGCLRKGQSEDQLAATTESMVEAARQLNEEARAAGGGKPAIELGYLLGAVRTAALRTGAHRELVRELIVASRYTPSGGPLPTAVLVPFGEGFVAGHESG